MTREQLLYKITGSETPKFLTDRENRMVDLFIGIVNNLEQQISNHSDNSQNAINDSPSASIFSHWKDEEPDNLDSPVIKHFQD